MGKSTKRYSPYIGEGPHSLMGKAAGPAQEEKNDEEMSILVTGHCCIIL